MNEIRCLDCGEIFHENYVEIDSDDCEVCPECGSRDLEDIDDAV